MTKAEDHLRYLEGGLAVLGDYLLSSEVFWPIGVLASEGEPALPQLTMGGLLLTVAFLRALPLVSEQRERFERLDAQLEAVRRRWQVAWGRKCQQSFRTRLRMWRNFLEEFREQPTENADRYTYEVKWRVMLHLLKEEAQPMEPAELNLLAALDSLLRHHLTAGWFVWDEELAAGFPPGEYWFLYGRLAGEIN